MCLCVCVCVCVSVFLSVRYYCFFSDCRICLFSSLAARVFNKLTRYSLLVVYVFGTDCDAGEFEFDKREIHTTVKTTGLSVTVGVAGWAWSLHGKQT